ncbi:AAA family ATPase [Arthrobacter bussei]|uniref:AAA family ATPase n=1 Tax=Arthrobacter bussei TaxID=2594179 RepID=UPI003BAD8830
MAGPNGVGKSSFFDGLQSWHRLRAWNSAYADDAYSAKVGAIDASNWYDRVVVEVYGDPRDQAALQKGGVYFRSAYRHEANFMVQPISQPESPTGQTAREKRAIDADQQVAHNYQRLLWQTFSAVFDETTSDATTKGQIRDRLIGQLRDALLRIFPELTLTRVGADAGANPFEFSKGSAIGFPYLNLSAGERAVFDLLLDAVVKAEFFSDALWCIDEPEVHIGTRAQGALLRELLLLVPSESQLFIASHSLGLMSEAMRISKTSQGEVVFLDFGDRDFDEPVVMKPVIPSREFWKKALLVALDDVATLVAPSVLVICEGGADGFDAKCYRTIFAGEFPDTDFLSVGNSRDAQADTLGLTSAMQAVSEGTHMIRLRDRDLANDEELSQWRSQGTKVLTRRHIECYLYDPETLEAFCDAVGLPEEKLAVLEIRRVELEHSVQDRGNDPDDLKSASGSIYSSIRKHLKLTARGSSARSFAEVSLAPLIQPGTKVYDELKRDIFG